MFKYPYHHPPLPGSPHFPCQVQSALLHAATPKWKILLALLFRKPPTEIWWHPVATEPLTTANSFGGVSVELPTVVSISSAPCSPIPSDLQLLDLDSDCERDEVLCDLDVPVVASVPTSGIITTAVGTDLGEQNPLLFPEVLPAGIVLHLLKGYHKPTTPVIIIK